MATRHGSPVPLQPRDRAMGDCTGPTPSLSFGAYPLLKAPFPSHSSGRQEMCTHVDNYYVPSSWLSLQPPHSLPFLQRRKLRLREMNKCYVEEGGFEPWLAILLPTGKQDWKALPGLLSFPAQLGKKSQHRAAWTAGREGNPVTFRKPQNLNVQQFPKWYVWGPHSFAFHYDLNKTLASLTSGPTLLLQLPDSFCTLTSTSLGYGRGDMIRSRFWKTWKFSE